MTCTVSDDVAMPQRNGANNSADQPADDSLNHCGKIIITFPTVNWCTTFADEEVQQAAAAVQNDDNAASSLRVDEPDSFDEWELDESEWAAIAAATPWLIEIHCWWLMNLIDFLEEK